MAAWTDEQVTEITEELQAYWPTVYARLPNLKRFFKNLGGERYPAVSAAVRKLHDDGAIKADNATIRKTMRLSSGTIHRNVQDELIAEIARYEGSRVLLNVRPEGLAPVVSSYRVRKDGLDDLEGPSGFVPFAYVRRNGQALFSEGTLRYVLEQLRRQIGPPPPVMSLEGFLVSAVHGGNPTGLSADGLQTAERLLKRRATTASDIARDMSERQPGEDG